MENFFDSYVTFNVVVMALLINIIMQGVKEIITIKRGTPLPFQRQIFMCIIFLLGVVITFVGCKFNQIDCSKFDSPTVYAAWVGICSLVLYNLGVKNILDSIRSLIAKKTGTSSEENKSENDGENDVSKDGAKAQTID